MTGQQQPAQSEPVLATDVTAAGAAEPASGVDSVSVIAAMHRLPYLTKAFLLCADPAVAEYAALWTNVRAQETFDNWQKLVQFVMKLVRPDLRLFVLVNRFMLHTNAKTPELVAGTSGPSRHLATARSEAGPHAIDAP